MLIRVAPIKDVYLARGPRVCVAWDSISPGVRENNVNDAISGMNNPPAYNLRIRDIATAHAPATIPPIKNDLEEIRIANTSLLWFFLFNYDLSLFPISNHNALNSERIQNKTYRHKAEKMQKQMRQGMHIRIWSQPHTEKSYIISKRSHYWM